MAEAELSQTEEMPRDPKRVRAFASFFKNYMSLSTLVAAALPIPVTAFKLIPTFATQTGPLSVYTPLFCFLVLAYIFYQRHSLARLMFWEVLRPGEARRLATRFVGALPALAILTSFLSLLAYHSILDAQINSCPGTGGLGVASERRAVLLAECWLSADYDMALTATYISTFVFAEAAFVLMAVKEYVQDLVKLSDTDVIAGMRSASAPKSEPPRDHSQGA